MRAGWFIIRSLVFFRARTSEWLRAHGVTQSTLAMEHALLFAVTQVHVDFVAPAKLDDVLQVSVSLVKRGGASLIFEQCIVRTHDAKELIRATVRAACLNAKTFLPERIPVKLLKK